MACLRFTASADSERSYNRRTVNIYISGVHSGGTTYLALECERRPSRLILECIIGPITQSLSIRCLKSNRVKDSRMIERMRDEALDAHDGQRALPRDLASEFKSSTHYIIAGPRYDARDETEAQRILRAERAARECKLIQERRVPDEPR
jgi:hypothetical protein